MSRRFRIKFRIFFIRLDDKVVNGCIVAHANGDYGNRWRYYRRYGCFYSGRDDQETLRPYKLVPTRSILLGTILLAWTQASIS